MVHNITGISSLSLPTKMPLVRRRRPLVKLSCSPVTTVDAQGIAYLCFPEDYSWFQGNISTDDESNYSLYGERVTVTAEEKVAAAVEIAEKVNKLTLTESDEENNNSEETNSNDNTTTPTANGNSEQPATEDYYHVTMIDHFSGEKHVLPKIYARKLEGSTTATVAPGQQFTSQHEEVTFKVENVYKGQKAEIMIHRYLGSPSLKGVKCLLCTGEINILFDDIIEMGRSWSL